ncbi:HAMP domain-containing histidine kinase [Ruminococcaceae bacterium OttesenSCG-928-L11]|nr:HAMP domain-containing histidine kinase [Ruminococcaceae bacterium OttesenSCG-928-L11]
MINLLRNREALSHCGILAVLGVAGTVLCALTGGVVPGLTALATGVLALLCSGFFTVRRYREIARMSDCLSCIVAGSYDINLWEYKEGELSILYDQLHKVTRTLSHQAEALQKDKLWLADTMTDISHQLKTPLTSMAMLADLLGDRNLPEAKRDEFLSGIRSGIERIRWLTLSLLKLSRMDANAVVFRQEPIQAKALVEHALLPLRIPMELKRQQLETDVDDAVVTGDISWLSESLGNLLKNAMEHTPVGGSIAVCCRDTPLYVLLEIRDTGPGIPPEELPRVFERFFRGKHAASDSIGIGLALSKSIVVRHGGTLEASNLPEGGACFAIKLYKTTV